MESDNSTACAGLNPADGESLVTWQTAWFAVVAIAMNSMSSPNGMVLGFPSAWGEVLRSSPIICLFDALELSAFWLFVIVFNGEGPCTAARRVARVRFGDALSTDEEGANSGGSQSISELRSRFWIAQAAFGIGTLTQAVKLFGLRGVYGSQICAAFYLYSWFVSQALIFAAGHGTQKPLPAQKPGLVRAITAQGLLPYIPFHVWGVIIHAAWLYGLQEDLIQRSSFVDMGFLENGLGSITWTVILIALSAVIPFVLYKMDSFRCISLSAAQIRRFPITLVAAVFIMQAWSMIAGALFSKGGAGHCSSLNNSMDWSVPDLQLCAFTPATRDRISGLLPLIYFFCLTLIMTVYPTYFTDQIWVVVVLISEAVFLSVGLFPRSIASWFASRAPSRLSASFSKLQLREIVNKYILSTLGILGTLFVLLVPFVMSTVGVIVNMWWQPVYILLLLTDWLLDSGTTTSFEVAGCCFVGANLVWSLLWFWKAWDVFHPECTAKPGWTEYLG
ncbi:hypothetical protein F5Y10DRAFT_286384 [Nemania abortiva]|nr:hypothetical protein F5Y10DRAFT_286384 [Nemania abortiva]